MAVDPLFTPNTQIAEAGRAILANELDTVWAHHGALLEDTPVVAVHETRKAIRRTFTAVKLFKPFFKPGVLEDHRRQLRKIMRRLGRSRDIAVFLLKLMAFEEAKVSLPGLRQCWQDRKREADGALRLYLEKPKRRIFLDTYSELTRTPGLGVSEDDRQIAPDRVRHLAPLLIQQQMAKVRAYDDQLKDPSLDRLHQLRIQMKDLRYTLGFFAPVLGPEIGDARSTLKMILDLLGDLNDAKVALRLLDRTLELEKEVSIYRVAKEDEINRLLDGFPLAWKRFDSPSWRREVGAAMAII